MLLKLTGLLNYDFSWKVLSGSASSSTTVIIHSHKETDLQSWVVEEPHSLSMPVSGSEKHGVSVLGCRFPDKAEHVPIKKRRFLFRSPSPPPRTPSPPHEEVAGHKRTQDGSGQTIVTESTSTAGNLGQIVDNRVDHCENTNKGNEQVANDDFSGISILAAAACGSSLGRDTSHAEHGLAVEEHSVQAGTLDGSLGSLSKGSLKEDFRNSEISTEAASLFVSTASVGLVPISAAQNSEQKDPSGLGVKSNYSGEDTQDVSCSKTAEAVVDSGVPARDDRLHWDLNVVMDAWVQPFDDSNILAATSGATSQDASDVKSGDDVERSEPPCSSGVHETKGCDEKQIVPSVELKLLVARTLESHEKDRNMNACSNVFEPTSKSDNSFSSECKNNTHSPLTASESKPEDAWKTTNSSSLLDISFSNPLLSGAVSEKDSKMDPIGLENIGPATGVMVSKVDASPSHHFGNVKHAWLSDSSCSIVSKDASVTTQVIHGTTESQVSVAIPHQSHAEAKDAAVDLAYSDTGIGEAILSVDEDRRDLETSEGTQGLSNVSHSMETDDAVEVGFHVMDNDAMDKNDVSSIASENASTMMKVVLNKSHVETQDVAANLASSDKAIDADEGLRNLATSERTQGLSDVICGIATGDAVGAGLAIVEDDAKSQKDVCNIMSNTNQDENKDLNDENDGTMIAVGTSLVASEGFPVSGCHDASKTTISEDLGNQSDRIALSKPFSLKCSNAVSCNPSQLVKSETVGELQEGYDSQYEDGELRESTGLAWEDYDGVNPEAEHLGCGSEGESASASGFVHAVATKDGKEKAVADVISYDNDLAVMPDKLITDDYCCKKEDDLIRLSDDEKIKRPTRGELPDTNKAPPNIISGLRDGGDSKDRVSSHVEGFACLEAPEMRGSVRAYRRSLQSRIEGPAVNDESFRNNRLDRMGSSFRYKFGERFVSRYDRDAGFAKSSESFKHSLHNQTRGRQFDSWDGSSGGHRGVRRHCSPGYHRHTSSNEENVGADVASGFQAGCKLRRDWSPDKVAGRGRFARYSPPLDNRGSSGRYHGPSPDDNFQSSLKYRRSLSRREKSFSPIGRRGYTLVNHPHGKSPSRSRTRSPNTRHSSRDRPGVGNGGNFYVRQQSRSPNFRSEVRDLRMRSPHHHHPRFPADNTSGFRSFSRNHGSPPHNSRWRGAGKEELDNFGELGYKQRTSFPERSPGRVRLRGEGFDIMDSSRALKPDVYHRSAHPGRFCEMDGLDRRLRSEETYDDRRKRCGLIHPVRRGYEDGLGRRWNHDGGDGFALSNNISNREVQDFHGRGTRRVDRPAGDVQIRFREGQRQFSADSKSFGFDAMDSSRRFKSSDHYRSVRPGRYAEIDGPGRGLGRDYNGERKFYGSVHLARRNDIEALERRLHDDIGRNQAVNQGTHNTDASDFHGRVIRNSDSWGELPKGCSEEQQTRTYVLEAKADDSLKSFDVQESHEPVPVEEAGPS